MVVEVGGVTINNQDKTITANGTYTADEGFTGLGNVTVDVIATVDGGELIKEIISGTAADVVADVDKVKPYCFYRDTALKSFKNSKTYEVGSNAFCNCSSLTDIDFSKISNVGDYAFSGCSGFINLNLPDFIKVGKYAFDSCDNLEEVTLSGACGTQMFYNCSALKKAILQNTETVYESMFYKCTNLTQVIGQNVKSVRKAAFTYCESIETIDFPKCNSLGEKAFSSCTNLKTLILRYTENALTFGAQMFYNTPFEEDGKYIYVPSALIETYKTKSGWSTYASQFRALEDYTVDGTVTGELDETKI